MDFSEEEQVQLNEQFEELSKELDALKKDNQGLKKPLDLDINAQKQESVKKDLEDALEEINKHQGIEESSESQEKQEAGNNATQKQKAAAQKMKEMSESLQQSSSASGGGSTITEDAEMLRQILENLITFSFKQENLFDLVQESGNGGIAEFSNTVRQQKELKGLFEHVDDSLFALSLRRAELSEFVNEQITEVYYNIDKSLESIAENQTYQGASYQQYVLTASNSLADFLAKLLDNMQQSMQPGQGQGQGEGFQLPDIIEGQQSLQEKMGKAGEQGKSGKQGKQGQKGQQGQKGDGGKNGKGEQGEKVDGGENGEGGEKGKKGNDGKNGGGENGEGQGSEGEGQGNGATEAELREIFEIYKEQQVIRQKLEEQLKSIIDNDKQDLAKKLVRQMESFENDLLENGITQRTMNKMNMIQQQLLKLENAALKQGQKKERESQTNQSQFQNTITTKPDLLKGKTNSIEILNRQALPLRQNYQNRVKRYFKDEG